MMTIGIICAMDSEFELIKTALSHGETRTSGLLTFYVAEKGGRRIVAATCGIGKVNAAACTQMLISKYHADCVINSGVSGALSDKLHIMDIVVADEVMYHDLEERFLNDYFPHCGRFPADDRLNALVRALCEEQDVPCVTGRVVSGDQFISDSTVKTAIVANTQGITTEMEGAAIGHVCYLNQIPFAVVRCISDGADDNGEMDFDTFVVHAAQRCAKITLGLIERI